MYQVYKELHNILIYKADPGVRGGVLHCKNYIGMCCPRGIVFELIWSENGYGFKPFQSKCLKMSMDFNYSGLKV